MVKKENGMNGVKVAVVAAAAAGDGKEIKRNAKSDRSVGLLLKESWMVRLNSSFTVIVNSPTLEEAWISVRLDNFYGCFCPFLKIIIWKFISNVRLDFATFKLFRVGIYQNSTNSSIQLCFDAKLHRTMALICLHIPSV